MPESHSTKPPKNKDNDYLSVVFSFRNEEDVLPELISRIRRILQEEIKKQSIAQYELIFVNDCSSDRSLGILLDQSKTFNDIKIINMSRRFGVSPCVMAGFKHSYGNVIIYMDADLQDPPELIPQLLGKWRNEESIDVVHTVRESRQGESIIKLALTRLGYAILNKITSINLPIEAGDFKLLSRRVVDDLLLMKEKRPFIRGLVCWVGYNQAFVPYHRQSRHAGKTKFPILCSDVINNFLDSALISFSSAPLKVAIFSGFLAILVDFGLLLHVLSEKLQGKAIPGWTALMIAILFIGSIQFFCIGIMGLYLNAIFEESKGRPNYIIESTHGFNTNNSSQTSS